MVDASYARYELSGFDRQLMMNKSLLDEGQESSDKEYYGFRARAEKDAGRADPTQRWQGAAHKKKPPENGGSELITGRRQTEWTGATRCPNEDNPVINAKA
jgi:hypothetical protein